MNLPRLKVLILLIAPLGAASLAAPATKAEANTLAPADSMHYDPPPVRPVELRVFALYGPHEFSTFSSDLAGPRTAGETASSGAPLDRQTEDRWLGFDKVQHVTFSFLWTLGTQYVAVNKVRFSEAQALPISIGTSAAAGLSKEYYDLRIGPTRVFSYKDLVADGVGILLAVGVILL